MTANVEFWAKERLATLLDMPKEDAGQMTTYLMSLPQDEASTYLSGMLGESDDAQQFIIQFVERRFKPLYGQAASKAVQHQSSPTRNQASKNNNPSSPSPKQWKNEKNVYRKADTEEAYFAGSNKQRSQSNTPQSNNSTDKASLTQPFELSQVDSAPVSITDKSKRKAQKKERLADSKAIESLDHGLPVGNSTQGLNGRLYCECLAAKHGLLCNCLTCGKIICKLEGPGPCPSCGTIVESAIQQVTMITQNPHPITLSSKPTNTNNKKKSSTSTPSYGIKAGANPTGAYVEGAFPTLMTEKEIQALRKAEAEKERLLEYQRESTRRTHVHDMASDFSTQASDKWLTPEERAQALLRLKEEEKLAKETRKRVVVSLDISGGRVIEASKEETRKVIEAEYKENEEKAKSVPVNSRMGDSDDDDKGTSYTRRKAEVREGSTGLYQNPSLRRAPVFVRVDLEKLERDAEKRRHGGGPPTLKEIKKKKDEAAEEEKRKAEEERLKKEGAKDLEGDAKARRAARRAEKEKTHGRTALKELVPRVQDIYDDFGVGGTGSWADSVDVEEPACG
ncbi:hypothetical protein HDV05_004559 [Chytridiales sp. JEL 0842]|nr:hypothetical protein HDV05_004559 [Chytridiales sp. JEL 0842]